MKQPRVELIDEARYMGLDELFFSETDSRGVIRFGNQVFARVAGYELDDMIGRPHNLVRHPDTPRATFVVLWEHLERGEPVVAYVKNLAADGRHYWVLAAVMPAGDGYVSIRLKPTSPLFDGVREAYARTVAAEQTALDAGDSPPVAMEQGLGRLLIELESLGFDSYDRFMRTALITELGLRDQALAAERNGSSAARRLVNGSSAHSHDISEDDLHVAARLDEIHRTCVDLTGRLAELVANGGSLTGLRGEILPKAQAILELGETIRLLALNAEIESNRLGEVAAALRAIAEQLGGDANAGKRIVDQLAQRLRALLDPIEVVLFDVVLATLKVEMVGVFVAEILADRVDATDPRHRSVALLVETFLDSAERIVPGLIALEDRLAGVDEEMVRLRRFLRTLNYVQLAGRIESSRNERVAVFQGIFDSADENIRGSQTMLEILHSEIASAHGQLECFGSLDHAALARLRELTAVTV